MEKFGTEDMVFLNTTPNKLVRRLDRRILHTKASMLLLVVCSLPLFFIPFSLGCKLLFIVIALGLIISVHRYISLSSLRNVLADESTAFELIRIAELSLGGHSNYFRAEGSDTILKAREVYGSCSIGDVVIWATFSSGYSAAICKDALTIGGYRKKRQKPKTNKKAKGDRENV